MSGKTKKILLFFIAFFVIYASAYIWRTSFVLDDTRYFSLFDDAMVSLRYADNLSEGYGPVWNPGQQAVEGYTNPLWMLYMSALSSFFDNTKVSLAIQISALIFLLFNIFILLKIIALIELNSSFVYLCTAILTMFYLPLNTWSLQGMEVSILTLLTTWSLYLLLRSQKNGSLRFSDFIPAGISILIRLDMSALFFVFLIYALWVFPKKRTKTALTGVLIFMSAIILQTVFRLHYYGEWLPNTYYLKMAGYPVILRIGRGLFTVAKFLVLMSPFVLVAFAVPLFSRKIRGKKILLLFGLVFCQMCYSVYVGGDAWEWWVGSNRYIAVVMPIFFLLTAAGADHLFGCYAERYTFFKANRTIMAAIFLIIALIGSNQLYNIDRLSEYALYERPFTVDDNIKNAETALIFDRILTAEASYTVATAGVLPYFLGRNAIDLLGKNDKYIANIDGHISEGISRYYDFNPGHIKWDYAYSIGELKPDAVIQLWKSPDDALPYLKDYTEYKIQGSRIYIKNNSPSVNFEELKNFTEK